MAKPKMTKRGTMTDEDFENNLVENQDDESALPEGFTRANPIDEAPLYWKPQEGASIQGELIGRYQRQQGEKGWYYQIRVTVPGCQVRDADKNDREAEPGEVVNCDERSGLSHLAKYAGVPEKRYEVFILAKEKIPLRKNAAHSFWRFALGAKELKD